MNGIETEGLKSTTGASSTGDEINEIFFSQGVLRRSDNAAAPVGPAA
ncbi:hypothetical protein QFZ42_002194 [Variovorax paradoxus]|jgi:hypothetical protein|nr:hypothetical protein [Variovorax paradoxus]MDQ0570360.1 hypothetical protein [Variovorax paradoxus]